MVTRGGRNELIRSSMRCFASQTTGQRELVIVHDSGDVLQQTLETMAGEIPDADIRIIAEEPGQTLGALRNRSVSLARYPLVCQWDDDDLYHPQRLARQLSRLESTQSDFCFLTDQLHLFLDEKLLFWDDWSVETWPGNCIQGTLLGRRERMPDYPELARGEDTGLLQRIHAEGYDIATLSGEGWLYTYVYHGDNAWDLDHHKAISSWKRLGADALRERLPILEQRLREYSGMPDSVVLLHERGRFEIRL